MKNNRRYVVDFNGLCDQTAHHLDLLLKVKEENPEFKATLFTIPWRTSPSTILKFDEHDWLALAPYGFYHTRGECLGWTSEMAEFYLKEASRKGISSKAFRAPAWDLDGETVAACNHLGYVVAGHTSDPPYPRGTLEYIYNDPARRATQLRSVHGHLTSTPTNHITDMFEGGKLMFGPRARFYFVEESYK